WGVGGGPNFFGGGSRGGGFFGVFFPGRFFFGWAVRGKPFGGGGGGGGGGYRALPRANGARPALFFSSRVFGAFSPGVCALCPGQQWPSCAQAAADATRQSFCSPVPPPQW